jgi:hypothetical protein
VCVKKAGDRRAKLDHNDFNGIFLGFTATHQHVRYIDLNTGIVKTSHHATFDEAWYLQPTRLPAAQLLYDMGLKHEDDTHGDGATTQDGIPDVPLPFTVTPTRFNAAPYPPSPLPAPDGLTQFKKYTALHPCQLTPLPLRETALPQHRTAAAAQLSTNITYPHLHCTKSNIAIDIVTEFMIGKQDISMIYLSPDPYHNAFEEEVDIRRFDLNKHCTAGLCRAHHDGCLFLGGIAKGTPCAKIP